MHIIKIYNEVKERVESVRNYLEKADVANIEDVQSLLDLAEECDEQIDDLGEYLEDKFPEYISNVLWQIISAGLDVTKFVFEAELELHRESISEKVNAAILNLNELLVFFAACDPVKYNRILIQERDGMSVEEKEGFLLVKLYELKRTSVYWDPTLIFELNDIEMDSGDESHQIAQLLIKSKYVCSSNQYRTEIKITALGKILVEKKLNAIPKKTVVTRNREDKKSMDIFISHSSKDKEIAKLLIDLIKTALNIPASKIRCTSVDGYGLHAGAATDEQLRNEVNDCKVLIGIISPISINSAYVLFELGARWGISKPLIPLVTNDEGVALLKGPLSGINALNTSRPAKVHQLIADLSVMLKAKHESAAVYLEKLDAVVKHSTVNGPILK